MANEATDTLLEGFINNFCCELGSAFSCGDIGEQDDWESFKVVLVTKRSSFIKTTPKPTKKPYPKTNKKTSIMPSFLVLLDVKNGNKQ